MFNRKQWFRYVVLAVAVIQCFGEPALNGTSDEMPLAGQTSHSNAIQVVPETENAKIGESQLIFYLRNKQ